MTDVSDSADSIIAKVKTREDEAKLCSQELEYTKAISLLQEAVRMIETSGWRQRVDTAMDPSEDEKKVASHVAECLGMMGGNFRRLNDPARALECFAEGRVYEASSKLGLESSYSIVNEIVIHLEMRTATASQLEGRLREAATALQRQTLAGRRVDRWAWADLGQCRLLIGDLDGAKKAYAVFLRLANLRQVGSACSVLASLANATRITEPGVSAALERGITMLQPNG